MCGPGAQAAQRPQVNNATSALPEMRQTGTGDQERTASVGRENVVPLFDGEALQLGYFIQAGVVDQHVEPAKFAVNFLDSVANAALIANITGNCQAMNFAGSDVGCRLASFCL